ncbi:MAG: DUF1570 domain-containing protein [Planctomycetaceae bacterium]
MLIGEVSGGPLVRVSDGEQSWEGTIVSLNKASCSLMDRQARLHHLNVSDLKSFEKLSDRYTPHSTGTFRQELTEEFRSGYEIAGTTHYLVCAPSGRASRYAQLFESIYRDVEQFYRVRGFRVTTPDVPLVAVVFRSQQEFVQYCVSDQVRPSPGLMGYYSLLTNRVALFDDSSLLSSLDIDRLNRRDDSGTIAASAAISGDTANTVIHETTHQVGYNIGAHSRLGGTPVWVVEGLATVLEPAGMRKKQGRQLVSDRVNSERSDWFSQRHRPTREAGSLAKLIASDEYFFQQTLNSYSEAWAFSFFLLENAAHRQNFVRYLQKIGQRDPLAAYSANDRLSDFQACFGDISRLEVEFLRFMDRR